MSAHIGIIANQTTDAQPLTYDAIIMESADGLIPLYSATAIVHDHNRSYCGQSMAYYTGEEAIVDAEEQLQQKLNRPLVRGDVRELDDAIADALSDSSYRPAATV